MNYAIPGFQSVGHPKADARVLARADGLIDFPVAENLSQDAPLPMFDIYMGAERGRELHRLAYSTSERYIYSQMNPETNLKEFRFRLRPDELGIRPGTYCFRFITNGEEACRKWVTIEDNPANPLSILPCPRPVEDIDIG